MSLAIDMALSGLKILNVVGGIDLRWGTKGSQFESGRGAEVQRYAAPMCRGKLFAVIARLMHKCLRSGWKW